ncbi:MAG: response regulator, partial [Deltaproteobacteria bacterium]|nr:response regulator [Deltaproteobacteria bacterium]
FEDYKDQFKVLTASNGKEALRILESNVIDFVVTDLNMPILDGIELLAYMSANFPTIPAIAVTAFSTPDVEEKLKKMGTLRILDKPVNLDMLAHTVLKGLARSHQGGNLTSISVSNFIQLIHRLVMTMKEREGWIRLRTCILGGNDYFLIIRFL